MPETRDIRSKDPDVDRRRRARFRTGWEHAVRDGRTYEERDGITWASAGNRCGVVLGPLSDDKRESMYELLVELHVAEHIEVE